MSSGLCLEAVGQLTQQIQLCGNSVNLMSATVILAPSANPLTQKEHMRKLNKMISLERLFQKNLCPPEALGTDRQVIQLNIPTLWTRSQSPDYSVKTTGQQKPSPSPCLSFPLFPENLFQWEVCMGLKKCLQRNVPWLEWDD